jgi:hypothetical protein
MSAGLFQTSRVRRNCRFACSQFAMTKSSSFLLDESKSSLAPLEMTAAEFDSFVAQSCTQSAADFMSSKRSSSPNCPEPDSTFIVKRFKEDWLQLETEEDRTALSLLYFEKTVEQKPGQIAERALELILTLPKRDATANCRRIFMLVLDWFRKHEWQINEQRKILTPQNGTPKRTEWWQSIPHLPRGSG